MVCDNVGDALLKSNCDVWFSNKTLTVIEDVRHPKTRELSLRIILHSISAHDPID